MSKNAYISIFLTTIFATGITHAMQQTPVVKFIVGGQSFEVPRDVALQAKTIKKVIDQFKKNDEELNELIFSDIISPDIMKYITQIFWEFNNFPDLTNKVLFDIIEKNLNTNELSLVKKILRFNYIDGLPLLDLLFAFNYLDFQPGIDLIARAIAKNDTLSNLFETKNPPRTNAQSVLAQKSKDLRPIIARFYYLKSKELKSVDAKSYGFSIQEYLDYQPQIIIQAKIGEDILNLRNKRLMSLDGFVNIPKCDQLRSLNLDCNQIHEIPVGALQKLTQLRKLYLNDNQISNIPTGALQGLTQLQELNLADNKISEINQDSLQGLVQLRWLNLNNNLIREIPVGTFQGLTQLQVLYLMSNHQLKEIPIEALQGLPLLRTVYLWTNKLSAANMKQLQGSLPLGTIHY
jgi:Leucine-rich repeat (LRR) protein